ncbi:UNVERIFIED_CONTAM: hypothetical protein GTU68_028588 [Idotea baltica]|nr:hypothetical protein [Idotea baltica]
MSETTFRDLNLNKSLFKALDDLNLIHPTSIQEKAFSTIMSGRDLIGIAQTGTGKTYAYLLPAIRQWTFSKERFPQILIIVPTRELVAQVVEEVEKLSAYTNIVVVGAYGGANIKPQVAAVEAGADVIVATPGRLLDLCLNFPEQIGVIHSNKSQNHRFNSVNCFTSGEYRILIATDIVARGIDVSEVSHVINFDIPEEAENYIHRIGRTGRADRKGVAISLVTEKEEEYLSAIESLMKYAIPLNEFPENVEISDVLIDEELPKIIMKNVIVPRATKAEIGGAFHEKKDKNKKTNQKLTRAQKMQLKYKKPIKRGGRKKKK